MHLRRLAEDKYIDESNGEQLQLGCQQTGGGQAMQDKAQSSVQGIEQDNSVC